VLVETAKAKRVLTCHGMPRFTRRDRHQTNGKAERFNRTMLEEWAYAQVVDSGDERATALPQRPHTYNHHRGHTALGGQPPISASTTYRVTTARQVRNAASPALPQGTRGRAGDVLRQASGGRWAGDVDDGIDRVTGPAGRSLARHQVAVWAEIEP
jgi:hypothetical protein